MRSTPGLHWMRKPECGRQIDWGHPLSNSLIGCWLFNEGSASPRNLVTQASSIPFNGPVWGLNQDGLELDFSVNDHAGVLDVVTPLPTIACSIVLSLYDVSQGSSGVSIPFGNGAYSTTETCAVSYSYEGDVAWGWAHQFNSGNTLGTTRYTPAAGFWDDPHQMIFTVSPAFQGIYADGVLAQGYPGGLTRVPVDPGFAIGASAYSTGGVPTSITGSTTQIMYAYLFARCLGAGEAAWLSDEPYAMIAPPNTRRFFSFGPPTFVETINDNEGVTDSVSAATIYVRVINDNEGVTDTVVTSGSGVTYSETINDNEGVTDAIELVLNLNLILAFPFNHVSVTDSVLAMKLESISDSVGVTDAMSEVTEYVRVASGNGGVTDSVATATQYVRDINDSEGVTDAGMNYNSAMSPDVLIELLCSGDVV